MHLTESSEGLEFNWSFYMFTVSGLEAWIEGHQGGAAGKLWGFWEWRKSVGTIHGRIYFDPGIPGQAALMLRPIQSAKLTRRRTWPRSVIPVKTLKQFEDGHPE